MDAERLHVLLADPHLQGGGQVRYVSSLARELTRFGHTVTIACRPGSVLEGAARTAGCAALPVFQFRGGVRPASWANDLRQAVRFIRNGRRPDILHVSGSQDHWTFGVADRLLGRPVCVVRTRHNTYRVAENLPNRILNRHWTDYEIVVCEMVRLGLSRQRTFDPAHLCTIHNGVDAELFRPDPESRARARAEFGYDDTHIVLGIVARLVKAKGHEFLFRAVAQLRNACPELRVLALGQGELEPHLRELTGRLGIADRVRFAGYRDDMPECVRAVDIGVQPSVDCDTSSFSLKELMASEVPVVASDYGGLKEIVSDGVEGLVVRAGTVDPLAAALRRLIESPESRGRMGRSGRRRVLAEFTLEVFARRTEQAYRRALGIHRQGKARLPR